MLRLEKLKRFLGSLLRNRLSVKQADEGRLNLVVSQSTRLSQADGGILCRLS